MSTQIAQPNLTDHVSRHVKKATRSGKKSLAFRIFYDALEIVEKKIEDANGLETWKKAIEKDGLIWPYHVSDLKVWDNDAAQHYGVQGIPSNVLINDKGIIIDKNLTKEKLIIALEKQLAE